MVEFSPLDNPAATLLEMLERRAVGKRQARAFDLPVELLVVEWNPPEGRPRLREAVDVSQDLGPAWIRFVEVPGQVHRALENPHRIPLFQMIGKNVGIRRAQGTFVLSTCNDLLFSDELFWIIAQRALRKDRFYRTDRFDLTVDRIPEALAREEQLDYCRAHVGSVCGKNERDGRSLAPFPGTREAFRSLSGSELRGFLALGEGRSTHINACGDFTLMTRAAWTAMRGYPELPLGDLYIDGLGVYQALALGLVQVILADPMAAFHLDHALSVSASGHRERCRLRPGLPYGECLAWYRTLVDEGRVSTPNGPLWGLADQALPECRLG